MERGVNVLSKHDGANRRRWRCSGGYGGQNEKTMGHGVPLHRGEAEARLSRGRGAPWSSGHGKVLATGTLPAMRKKSAHSSFPVKSSNKSGSVGCARSKQNY